MAARALPAATFDTHDATCDRHVFMLGLSLVFVSAYVGSSVDDLFSSKTRVLHMY